MDMVMVMDIMDMDTIMARGLLMPSLLLMLTMVMAKLPTDTDMDIAPDTMDMVMVMDIMDMDTIMARGLLMPSLLLMLTMVMAMLMVMDMPTDTTEYLST